MTPAEQAAPAITEGSQLDALRASGTKLVSDSGEIDLLRASKDKWGVVDATTNPSLVLKAAAGASVAALADKAVQQEAAERALNKGGGGGDVTSEASAAGELFSVLLGREILGEIPGRVSTETDARLAYDTEGIITQVRF